MNEKIIVKDVKIPFWSLVALLIKIVLASIPAVIIIIIVTMMFSSFFAVLMQF